MACAGKRDGWGPHSTRGSVKWPKADIPPALALGSRTLSDICKGDGWLRLMGPGPAFPLRSLVVSTTVATMQRMFLQGWSETSWLPILRRAGCHPALPGAVYTIHEAGIA